MSNCFRFSTTPTGVMQYAEFLNRSGTIKLKPAAWTDMFIGEAGKLPGR
jgi:NitT/TauT family transport system substrate-binding protein